MYNKFTIQRKRALDNNKMNDEIVRCRRHTLRDCTRVRSIPKFSELKRKMHRRRWRRKRIAENKERRKSFVAVRRFEDFTIPEQLQCIVCRCSSIYGSGVHAPSYTIINCLYTVATVVVAKMSKGSIPHQTLDFFSLFHFAISFHLFGFALGFRFWS